MVQILHIYQFYNHTKAASDNKSLLELPVPFVVLMTGNPTEVSFVYQYLVIYPPLSRKLAL
jgi:hypothetical protein